MTLQVIGAGFGRTGTLTLKTALEMLGFGPCHHMVEVIANADQIPFWNQASRGEAVEWEDVFSAYRSVVDWPGCHFYSQLADRYPEARVILSLRDPQRWFESMSETILVSMAQMGLAEPPIPDDHPLFFGSIISRDTFNFDYSKDNVIAAFERHNANVRASIAPERLLVFEASDGWEPLCAHLGVAVPAEPFPHVNDRAEFQSHAQNLRDVSGV